MTVKEAEARSYQNPILLYDGICILCNGFVKWLIKRDTSKIFQYATLQQTIGKSIIEQLGIQDDDEDTVVLIHQGQYYTHADVSLQIAKILGLPYSLFGILNIVPRSVRNLVYRWIARNRYRWFGKDQTCLIPTGEIRERLVELGS